AAARRLSSLTPKESEVLMHVIAGRLNKQIAGDLGISERTVKVHRGRVMLKMGVRSVPDLVRIVEPARNLIWNERLCQNAEEDDRARLIQSSAPTRTGLPYARQGDRSLMRLHGNVFTASERERVVRALLERQLD